MGQLDGKENRKGKILHLDGDRKYTEKSYRFYKRLGLNVVVRNIPEYRQPMLVEKLLEIYKPDILVITGHDSMFKKNVGFNNIYNYRNSKYFVESVKKARKYEPGRKLSIFAGACESCYEKIIMAGANFASAPDRILIDFKEPLIVANEIASTSKDEFITIRDIESKLENGRRGIGGVGSFGKMRNETTLQHNCNTTVTQL